MNHKTTEVTRKNYRMFKAGRRWVFACAVFFSVLGASAFATSTTVSADTVDTPAVAAVNNSDNETTTSNAEEQATKATPTETVAASTEAATDTASAATSDASASEAKTADATTVEATTTDDSSSVGEMKALNDDAATSATSAASTAPEASSSAATDTTPATTPVETDTATSATSAAPTTKATADTATEEKTDTAVADETNVQSSKESSDAVAETTDASDATAATDTATPAPAPAEAVVAAKAVAADPEGGIGGSFFATGDITASGSAVNGLKKNADGTYTGVITLDYSGSTIGLDVTTSKYVIKVPAELSPLVLQADKSDITGSFTGGFLGTPHEYTASDFTITQDTDGSAIITFSNPAMLTVAYAPVDITVNLNVGDMVNKSGMVIDPSDSNYSFDGAVVLPTSIIDWDVFSNWASTTALQTNHLMPAEVSQGIQKPYVVQPVEDNDTVVSGTGTPGASVKVYNEDRMTTLGVGTVNSNGYYSVTIPVQKQGTVLNVTQTTAADGESDATTVTVRHAPVELQQPTINMLYSGDTKVSGTANNAPGTQITISDQSKTVLGYGYTDANGLYSIDINRALRAGEIISAVASNGTDQSTAGERGVLEATEVSIDAPHINDVYAGQAIVTGTGQTAGDIITIENSARQVIGTGTVNSDRTWNVGVNTILEEGDIIYAIESDSKGNASPDTAAAVKAQQTVTIPAPNVTTPVYNTAETVHGQGHTANNTIRITDNQGNVIGTGTVGSNLNYVVALTRALNTGEIISVVETDGKNTSPETNVSVTTQTATEIHAPAIDRPVYTTDTTLTGTGSTAGNTIEIKDSNDNVVGTGTVNTDKTFTVNLNRPLIENEYLLVTEGNGTVTSSPAVAVVTKETVTTIHAPALDRPVYTTDTVVTGTGSTAGNTVTIVDQNGDTLGTGVVGNDLKFSVPMNRALVEGDDLLATETNGTVTSNPSVAVVEKPAVTEIHAPALDRPVYTTATTVTGKGSTAGNTISLTDQDGAPLGTATVNDDLTFTVELTRALKEGDDILATESNGTVTSNPSVAVVETQVTTELHAPVLDRPVYANATTVTGTGTVAGNTINITDQDGKTVGTTKVNDDLTFSVPLNRQLKEGDDLLATETDGNKTSSPSVAVVQAVPSIDAPTINDLNEGDTTVTGTGSTPGNTIIVIDNDGHTIGTSTVGNDGKYSVTVSQPLVGGDTISVEESNGTVTSAPASKVVKAVEYNLTIDDTVEDGDTTVTGDGTTEGNIVTLMDHEGTVIGTASVDRSNRWSITLNQPAVEGENLIAQESNGQTTSKYFSVTVHPKDTTPTELNAPIIDLSSVTDGSSTVTGTVTGTGVAGNTVTVKNSSGTTLGTGIVDDSGIYSVLLNTKLKPGDKISVTQSKGTTGSPAQTATVPTATEKTLNKPSSDPLKAGSTTITVYAGANKDGSVNVGNKIVVSDQDSNFITSAPIVDDGPIIIDLPTPPKKGQVYLLTETDGTESSDPVVAIAS
ncbi:Ig-like domain-containing protein [Lacticaseibacillus pantheris]|uniref:Ig-like domain-containing protein n=1 Tax=Lacticaseibacillus pantheris TaxID=171523 RepID=UPI00265B3F93|nr:Ig-like domain-containing protein [Lacticaseibacillus pantheris]WKF85122.1 Ig-like domain-containing protein [Lacticaseibacillus pantheris]